MPQLYSLQSSLSGSSNEDAPQVVWIYSGCVLLCFKKKKIEYAQVVHGCFMCGTWSRDARLRAEVERSSVEHKAQTRGLRSGASWEWPSAALTRTAWCYAALRWQQPLRSDFGFFQYDTGNATSLNSLRSRREAAAADTAGEQRSLTRSPVTSWTTGLLSQAKGNAFTRASRSVAENNSSSKLIVSWINRFWSSRQSWGPEPRGLSSVPG